MTREDFEQLVIAMPKGERPWWCVTGGWARDLLTGRRSEQRKDFDLVALKEDAAYWVEFFGNMGMSVRQKAQWPIREKLVGENFVYEKEGIKIDGWFIDDAEPTRPIVLIRNGQTFDVRVTSWERMRKAKDLFGQDRDTFGMKFHDLPESIRNNIITASQGVVFAKKGREFATENLSPWVMARDATVSAVGWARGGFKMASPDIAAQRITSCRGCEFYRNERCLKCGCFLSAKTKLLSSKCPIGRW